MELSPRALARWLPYLAAALGIESIVALTPPFTGDSTGFFNCLRALLHVPHIALLLGFAIAIPVMTQGGATRVSCQRLLYGGFAAIAVTALGRFADLDVYSDTSRPWLILQGIGSLLLVGAGPGIWGCAIAREEDLADSRIPNLARTFAAITGWGFFLLFVSEAIILMTRGPSALIKDASLILAVSSAILLAGRGCLLWSAINSWRRATDEGVVRDRVRWIKQLMIGWLLAGLVSSLITAFFWQIESHHQGSSGDRAPMLIWNGFVQLTLSGTVTILVAVSLEQPLESYQPRPKGPFFPEPPPADHSPIDVP